MKKLLLTSLLALGAYAQADSVPLGLTQTPASGSASLNGAVLYARDLTSGVIRQISVNPDGSLVTGGAGSVTASANSTITSNTSSYAPSGTIAYPLSSTTPTVTNITAAAGVDAPCLVCLGSNGGAAAGFKAMFTSSATVPAGIYSSLGHYVAASTTSQCWGPFFPGAHWFGLGVAGTSSAFADYQQAK